MLCSTRDDSDRGCDSPPQLWWLRAAGRSDGGLRRNPPINSLAPANSLRAAPSKGATCAFPAGQQNSAQGSRFTALVIPPPNSGAGLRPRASPRFGGPWAPGHGLPARSSAGARPVWSAACRFPARSPLPEGGNEPRSPCWRRARTAHPVPFVHLKFGKFVRLCPIMALAPASQASGARPPATLRTERPYRQRFRGEAGGPRARARGG